MVDGADSLFTINGNVENNSRNRRGGGQNVRNCCEEGGVCDKLVMVWVE